MACTLADPVDPHHPLSTVQVVQTPERLAAEAMELGPERVEPRRCVRLAVRLATAAVAQQFIGRVNSDRRLVRLQVLA